MGIRRGGMVSSSFSRPGISPTSLQPWEIKIWLQEGLPAAGAGKGTRAVVMSCPSSPPAVGVSRLVSLQGCAETGSRQEARALSISLSVEGVLG